MHGNVPIFMKDAREYGVRSHQRPKSALRAIGKALVPPHHSLYFSNLRTSTGEGPELSSFLSKHQQSTVLNIGSLSKDLSKLHPRIINLDISEYENIDVVGDAHCLPFRDNSIDIVLLKNVLEHIREPETALREIYRVLKPQGFLYAKVPFLQPFHAVPDHFQGYTESGMKEAFKEYRECSFGIAVGPGSMLSWMVREYLAVLFSFGNMKLYTLGLMVFGWLTFWIKFTDLFFRRNKLANRVTSAFYGLYQKI